MKKYILFDLDGTVTDPMLGITKSVQYALNKFDIKINNLQDLYKFIGPPLKESFMEYYNFNEEEAEKAIKYYREYFSAEGIYENLVYENIEKLLSILKEDEKKLIVATSKPTVFAEKILQHFSLSKYFDYICGSNLDGTRTRKSEIIQYILDKHSIENKSEVVMIGDREHDIFGAKAVGVDSIGVMYGYGTYEELLNSGADYIVNSINELGEVIQSL